MGVDVLSGVLAEYAASGVPVVFLSHQLDLVERLCEAVAIIKGGRLVAAGTVDELRDRGADSRRVRVSVELRDGATPADVGDSVRAVGTVTEISFERPTLTELFREAVAA